MPRTNSEWTVLDKELMTLVVQAWNALDKPPSLRAVSRAIGVSAPRVMDLRDHKNGRPLVDEYCDLCAFLHLDAAALLEQAIALSCDDK